MTMPTTASESPKLHAAPRRGGADGSAGQKPAPAVGRGTPLSLPNVLTYARIAAVPALAFCLYYMPGAAGHWIALGIFILAAVTDWLDGYLARAWNLQSALGRLLDPIADKLLVGAALMMLVADRTIAGVHVFAAIVILSREILVSGLRELLAEINANHLVRVSGLAKWKTAVQMIAIAVLIAGPAGDAWVQGRFQLNEPGTATQIGLGLLWVAAVLTIYTGYDYMRAGVSWIVEHDRNGGT